MDMNIHKTSQIYFKGYDARPLKGFFMSSNCRGVAEEMRAIGRKEGFKIFSTMGDSFSQICVDNIPKYELSVSGLWAQDYWTFVKDKLFSFENNKMTQAILDYFNLKPDFTQQIDRKSSSTQQLQQELANAQKELKESQSLYKENKTLIFEKMRKIDEINNQILEKHRECHIAGGNLFIAKNKKGKEFIIVGENDTRKYLPEEIRLMYGIDNVIVLPQMDYHLDLFIRPLNNGKVLVADDKMSMKVLTEGLGKFKSYILSLPVSERKTYSKLFVKYYKELEKFYNNIRDNTFVQANSVAKILEEKNFEVVRVPARIYEFCEVVNDEDFLRHKCNYLNANVLINDEGKLVYITNKSNVDNDFGISPEVAQKIGFSFEKSFIDSISPYVEKEHFYFIKGEDDFVANEMLKEFQGGIHCACAEIPKNIGENIK